MFNCQESKNDAIVVSIAILCTVWLGSLLFYTVVSDRDFQKLTQEKQSLNERGATLKNCQSTFLRVKDAQRVGTLKSQLASAIDCIKDNERDNSLEAGMFLENLKAHQKYLLALNDSALVDRSTSKAILEKIDTYQLAWEFANQPLSDFLHIFSTLLLLYLRS